jgi:hypothetical protein
LDKPAGAFHIVEQRSAGVHAPPISLSSSRALGGDRGAASSSAANDELIAELDAADHAAVLDAIATTRRRRAQPRVTIPDRL